MDKKILIPVAGGSEELETITILNLLRRAEARVVLAGVNEITTCARNTKLIPDKLIESISHYDVWDAIIIPGGRKGVNELAENDTIQEIVTDHFNSGKLLGLICAAPTLLKRYKLIDKGMLITSNPGLKFEFKEHNYTEENVAIHNNLITSRGAGTAIEFTLKLIEILFDKDKKEKVAQEIVYEL